MRVYALYVPIFSMLKKHICLRINLDIFNEVLIITLLINSCREPEQAHQPAGVPAHADSRGGMVPGFALRQPERATLLLPHGV